MTEQTEALREEIARAWCASGGFDPDEMMPNDGPRWKYYLEGADAILPLITRERERAARAALEAAAELIAQDDIFGHDAIRALSPSDIVKGMK